MEEYNDYDEYLEIFDGDEETATTLSTQIREALKPLEKMKCEHSKTVIFPDGKGYCVICGHSFSKLSDLKKKIKKCTHSNTYETDNGLYVCWDCHEEIEIYNFDPEWRYYYGSDNRLSKDPARCHRGRPSGHSLEKMFAENRVDIPDAIRKRVESKYMKIVGNETVRGKGRKAIVAACLFYVYPEFGEYRTSDYIRGLFELDKKNMSAGLSRYYEVFPEARNLEIRPVDLIRWILTLTGIKISHYRKIVKIAQYLEGSSQLLERSSPQSVASAIVYFYLCLHPKYKHELGLTKNRFADKTMLSDITVGKLVKEAAAVGRCVVAV